MKTFGDVSVLSNTLLSFMSEYHIYIFLGTAAAGLNNGFGYAEGERHALLIFSRQPSGTKQDWELAIRRATDVGWEDVKLQKGGQLHPESLNISTPEKIRAYEDALEHGGSIIVYQDAIET